MNAFERKVALKVLGVHVAIVLGVLMLALLKGCFRPKPKPEIVTFIEFGSPAPAVQVQEVAEQPEEPPSVEPPSVQPQVEKPPPPPKPIPEPQKTQLTPIKKEPAKMEPPKKVEEKKWKPTPIDDIEIGKEIAPKVTKPAVTEKEIEQALKNISTAPAKTATPGPVGNPDEISAYDAHIYSIFYNAWVQPASPGVRPAEVTISISSSGRILSSRLSRTSGDTAFDATVMTAVLSVTVLPKKPPTGYPLDNIVVQFRIID